MVTSKANGHAGVADSKPYIQHDPKIGYRYIANVDLKLPRPGGGHYHFQTNPQGLRSSREYPFAKPEGTTRVILCGDSMSAGQYVSNEQRLSEQLERRVPGFEIINLSLEGSGTDQQLLLYEDIGQQYEHDAVLLMPFLSNLRRNMVDAREGIDFKTGRNVLRGKPRFELVDGMLKLRNVPVPKIDFALSRDSTLTDSDRTVLARLKSYISGLPGVSVLKKVGYAIVPWEPFPEFRNAQSPAWQVMEAIVRRFKISAGERPLVVVPTFSESYVRYRMSRAYWRRFKSLSSISGVHVIDLLPPMEGLGAGAVRCFQVPYDMHLSAYGHLIVAEILAIELRRLGLIPGSV